MYEESVAARLSQALVLHEANEHVDGGPESIPLPPLPPSNPPSDDSDSDRDDENGGFTILPYPQSEASDWDFDSELTLSVRSGSDSSTDDETDPISIIPPPTPQPNITLDEPQVLFDDTNFMTVFTSLINHQYVIREYVRCPLLFKS